MGKRSSFDRLKRDGYDTPLPAMWSLFPHLPDHARFAEPCAGRGVLIDHLENNGFECVYACDLKPRATMLPRVIEKRDALTVTRAKVRAADMIVTNPPWTHEVLMALIAHFMTLRPSWLLLDADWMHNQRTSVMVDRCSKVVSIGRVKWFADSKHVGKSNCCWYFFPQHHRGGPVMIGR